MKAEFPEDELLRLACIYAEQDRDAFVKAYKGMMEDEAAQQALEFLKALRSYRLKRWGKTALEVVIESAKEEELRK